MRRIEIAIPKSLAVQELIAQIDNALTELGLIVVSKTSLATLPGSIHWHVKKPSETGTLEITVSPRAKQAWFGIHANREASWIDDAISQFSQLLAQEC